MARTSIMVVEDEYVVAADIRDILEKMGYTVSSVATSGEKAIVRAEEDRPDLVLMDIVLEGQIDGIEAAVEIRNRLQIPVIFLTAYADDDLLERAKVAEPFGYILKPFEEKELHTTIEMALYKAWMEHKLTESEEKYRSLVESSEDSISLVDRDCRYLFLNKKYLSRFDLPAEKLIGRGYSEFHSKENTKEFTTQVEEVFKTGESQLYECRSQRDGRYFFRTLSPVKDSEGRSIAVTVISKDITDRKRMEEELLRSEEKYRTLVEQSVQGIVVIQDGRIVFTNRPFSDISGYPLDELYAFSPEQVMAMAHPDDQELVWGRLRKRLRGEPVPRLYEFRGIRKDGSERWLEMCASLITYNGKPAVQGTFIDITERKRAEEELLKVQKLESLGVLAGGIAHDFNNILAALVGNISLAKIDVDRGDKRYGLLEHAEKACWRAQALTEQLLTFSHGGAPVKKRISISELIKEWGSFALRGSKVTCDFTITEDLWPLEVDEGQIIQVVHNLIINAVQAMPEGGVIKASVENLRLEKAHGVPLKPGRYLRISIQDHGIGIAEEHLPKIFDPYFTTKQKGSGLGLATAYSIIKRHHGHITVESRLGVGTTFRIYLPASEKAPPKTKEEEKRSLVGKGKILVMDDEEMIRETAKQMLSHIGYETETAREGGEAIELYKKAKESGEPFDAVILDLTVPGGMGGKEAIHRLLEMDPGLVAIVSSGYSNDPILSDFREYGFSAVATKPYGIEELRETLSEAMKGRV